MKGDLRLSTARTELIGLYVFHIILSNGFRFQFCMQLLVMKCNLTLTTTRNELIGVYVIHIFVSNEFRFQFYMQLLVNTPDPLGCMALCLIHVTNSFIVCHISRSFVRSMTSSQIYSIHVSLRHQVLLVRIVASAVVGTSRSESCPYGNRNKVQN